MPVIERLAGSEILDSRGNPTVGALCLLASGVAASASVPSGASRGVAEAWELRDGDRRRFRGLGCVKAAANISGEISRALAGERFETQAELDRALIEYDGTPNKSRLGANAILAVSLAFARASAIERGVPLYRHLAEMLPAKPATLPRLTINLFSGGKHAGKQVAIQDVLIVPARAASIRESLEMAHEVYYCAGEICLERYGMRMLTADEGGLAPDFAAAEEMLDTAAAAIRRAGFEPGRDVALAVDVASSHFHEDGRYRIDGRALESAEMIGLIAEWVARWPIVSVEDGLAEEDWENWPKLREAIAGRALVLGDDLLCTNAERIRRAIGSRACDALLLKVNQVGTLTEAAESYRLARQAGWMVTISVRSGETEDNWAADLAAGWAGDQFKNGSIRQSERLAKYNRLLAIEDETGWPLVNWPGLG